MRTIGGNIMRNKNGGSKDMEPKTRQDEAGGLMVRLIEEINKRLPNLLKRTKAKSIDNRSNHPISGKGV